LRHGLIFLSEKEQNFDPTEIKTATLGQSPLAPLPSAFKNAALAWSPHSAPSVAAINVAYV